MSQLSLETHKEHDGWFRGQLWCLASHGSVSPFLRDTDETATLKEALGNIQFKPCPLSYFSLIFVELACSESSLPSLGKYQPGLLKSWPYDLQQCLKEASPDCGRSFFQGGKAAIVLTMEKSDGKRQSPECPFCLAAVSYEGFLHSHCEQANVSRVGAGAPRAEQTPTRMMLMSITQ